MSNSKHRVLIADDYDDTRLLLGQILAGVGVPCDTAEDGKAAIEAYRRALSTGNPYAVLILDAAMPCVTGYEVADFVRKNAGDATTPIIIYTGSDGPLVEPHAMHVGVTEVWYKPLDADQFRIRVAELMGLKAWGGRASA